MSRFRSFPFCLLCLLSLISAASAAPAAASGSDAPRAPDFSTLPLGFEPNQGQAAEPADFLARARAYTLLLSGEGAVFRLREPGIGSQRSEGNKRERSRLLNPKWRMMPDSKGGNSDALLRLRLLGAARHPAARPLDPLPGRVNYFLGNDPRRWHTKIPTFAKVRYQDVYRGIDMVYYGDQAGQLEYDFVVRPGGDPDAIRFRIETELMREQGKSASSAGSSPHDQLQIDRSGDLVIHLEGGDVRFHKPVVYQFAGEPQSGLSTRRGGSGGGGFGTSEAGLRTHVDGDYVLTDSRQVSFALGPYDHSRPLIIDPALTYSTYLGGTGSDVAYGITLDPAGNILVTGTTGSTNFPIISGGVQTTYGGGGDVFLTKFNASGSGLVFSTYLGGSEADTADAVQEDSSGNIFLVGTTFSANFPTTPGAYQTTYGGNGDVFVAKIKSDGTALLYSTYLGGTQEDQGAALALDSRGDVYLTGSTQSIDFPTMDPLQLALDGVSNVFVAELNPTGTSLLYSTYLGGSSSDYGTAIALDGAGDVYVSGYTYSTDFPTQNAYQSALAGASDVFVTEFKPGSASLLFSTFLGGSSIDQAFGMALDSVGSIYLVGETQSDNFPVTPNAFQSINNGSGDVFITKFAPGATYLVYSTLLGGAGTDQATALALDAAGEVYLTGFTQSSGFPLLDPFQKVLGISGAGTCTSAFQPTVTCSDAFVAKLGPSGSLIYSSFLGGDNADVGQAIVVDSAGTAYVAGSTASSNFPTSAGAYQWAYGGTSSTSNAFVAKVASPDAPGITLSPQEIDFGNQDLNTTSNPIAVTLGNEGSAALLLDGITTGPGIAQTNNCGTQLSAGGSTCTIQVTFSPTLAGAQTNQIVISDNSAGSPHYVTVTGNGVLSGGALTLTPTTLNFPAQLVTTTSAPQSVIVVNTGYVAVTITQISVTGDYAETNTCGGLPTTPTVLNVGQACTINVTFTPTGSGSRAGSLTIGSNAATAAAAVGLEGTGSPQFTLSANSRSSVIVVGTTSATFSIAASAPSSFTSNITLSCTSGATCTFNPTAIAAGGASTLTVTGLSATTANPLNFTVTGTAQSPGTQTATVALAIFLADFSLSATPVGTSVAAGSNATYTVTVAPTNGFNKVVILNCGPIPAYTTCTFTPPSVAFSGQPELDLTSTLTVTTTAQSDLAPRRPPAHSPELPPLVGVGLIVLLAFAAILAAGPWLRPQFRFLALGAALALVVWGGACDTYVNPISITPVVNGTPSGNYQISIKGTLGTNSRVIRATTVNLTVTP